MTISLEIIIFFFKKFKIDEIVAQMLKNMHESYI